MSVKNSLLDVSPEIPAELDPAFRPAVLANRNYQRAARESGHARRLSVALERNNGLVSRRDLDLLPAGMDHDDDSYRYVERIVKFLLWANGGWKLYVSGDEGSGHKPPVHRQIARKLAAAYSQDGERAFDADLIAAKVYDKTFEVVSCETDEVPEKKGMSARLGGHLDGCRIGFDLGASDYKLAAVVDGEPVFSTEIPWNPTVETEIEYHYSRIKKGLELAASHLPRVDAIGGSSAGIFIDSQVMVASLFRGLSPDDFESKAKPLFLRMKDEWGVPFEVVNDGDVTALAGAMSLDASAMLGMAMGSSEAVGYLDREGALTGQLNELAFAPVDMNPSSPADEWSRDNGIGAMFFSQQAVAKLAPRAGFEFPPEMLLAERLRQVQAAAEGGDENARKIFSTIGVYLGYTIPHYADFYDFSNLLILGRVTSGTGGEIILDRARSVLAQAFPETAECVTIHVPDEKSRRVGQAVAAASLPEIPA